MAISDEDRSVAAVARAVARWWLRRFRSPLGQAMTSLRELGRRLQVSHTTLSKAARAGTLTRGVKFDAAGRLVVEDAAAAIAEWRTFHPPRHRMPSMPSAPPHADFFADLDKQTLLEWWVEFDLLARALVRDALDADGAPDDGAFVERVLRRLWDSAADSGADEVTVAKALELLRSLVTEHRELGAAPAETTEPPP